jgi:hypothetical protein
MTSADAWADAYEAERSVQLRMPTCTGSQTTAKRVWRCKPHEGHHCLLSIFCQTVTTGSSTSTTTGSTPVTVYALGGSAPLPSNGPGSAAVTDAFPDTAAPLRQYREYRAYACVPPGQYTLARFDSTGTGTAHLGRVAWR